MRVTNNMIIENSKTNINSNKVLVDYYNTQMTTQKKISRASEDPVIAVRALRMQTTMSHINQYLDNNIEQASAWLEITQTALVNMKDILTDIRTQCVYGSTDSLKAEDRQTILNSLNALADQVYTEGNSDYAGRTVFTGYRTGSKLTFMEEEKDTTYVIDQSFDYTDLHDHRYYYGDTDVPADASTQCTTEIGTNTYSRIRLAYGDTDALTDTDKLGNLADYKFSYTITEAVTVGTTMVYDETFEKAETIDKDIILAEDLVIPAGTTVTGGIAVLSPTVWGVHKGDTLSTDYTIPAGSKIEKGSTLPAGTTVSQIATVGQTLSANTKCTMSFVDAKTVTSGTDTTGQIKVYENEEEWYNLTKKPDGTGMTLGDNEIIYIRSTGEFVFGDEIAHTIAQSKADIDVTYTKTGFDEGLARPEYYYDCKMSTPDLKEQVEYTKEDQKIEFTISNGITLPANTQASEVFDTSIARDMEELIDVVTKAIEANDKVDRITEMMNREQYVSDADQANLQTYLDAAQKEADYANDNLQKTYSQYITNFENYLEDVNVALTNVGSLQQRLSLTQNRVENQKMTVQELQSNNEDRDISDIIIDYYASYNAYTASLTAASKVGEQTLLNYL